MAVLECNRSSRTWCLTESILRLVSRWLDFAFKLTKLGIYDDRKDTVLRELDGKREELDGLAARCATANIVTLHRSCEVSTLQSLNLPGSIQALERPVGLPPSLMRKSEEVDSAGGVERIHDLLDEVNRLSMANTQLLSEVILSPS
jgi:programmed cell death 6-interacting protein